MLLKGSRPHHGILRSSHIRRLLSSLLPVSSSRPHAFAHVSLSTTLACPWFDTRRISPRAAREAAEAAAAVVRDNPATMMVAMMIAIAPRPESQHSKQPAGTWATVTRNVAPGRS